MAAHPAQRCKPQPIGEVRELAVPGPAADVGAAEKEKNPGEQREIVGGKEIGAMDAQREQPAEFIPSGWNFPRQSAGQAEEMCIRDRPCAKRTLLRRRIPG